MTLTVILVMIVLLLLGIPLYIFLFGIASYLFWQADIPLLSTVVSFQKLQSQEFVYAIPLFTFAGYLLSRSQSPERIINFVQKCFYFLPASASIITVIIMALFTALTGASGVAILALGGLLFPLLKKASENEKFSHGIITASGSIGLLLAPSLPVIIYTVIANQNMNSGNGLDLNILFKNALIPSLIIFVSFFGYSLFKEKRLESTGNWKEIKKAILGARWEIPIPFLVYGGIYSGLFTVLEAAVLVALYAFAMVFLIYGDLSLKRNFVTITMDSLKLSGGIFIIMATAFVLTNYLIYERIPDRIFEWISPYLTNHYTFLIAINILLLITGCFLDIFSAILIVLPLMLPVVEKYQINPYHFALIFLVNLEIGYLTPPVGLNLFISSYSFKKSITYLYKTIIPFFLIMLLILMAITYVPSLSTVFSRPMVASEKNLPPKVKKLSVAKIGMGKVEILIFTETTLQEGMGYRVYYLDEEDAEKDVLYDFGEFRDFVFDGKDSGKNWRLEAGKGLRIHLDELFPDTPYSVIVEPYVISQQEMKMGLSSSPITFTTIDQ